MNYKYIFQLITQIVMLIEQMHTRSIRNRTRKVPLASRIIFPDQAAEEDRLLTIRGTPNCARGLTFCEDIDHYPAERFRNVLAQADVLAEFFETPQIEDDLTDRLGSAENFLCPSIKTIIFPKVAKNRKQRWKYIYNLDDYNQGIHVEICSSKESPCEVIGELPYGVRTFCRQKYIERKMLASDEHGNPTPDNFMLPSACACAYKRDIRFLVNRNR